MLCLRQNLELVSDDFDYIIIDTNPGNTTLNYASICACDGILSPIKADNFSYVGVTDLLTTINDLKSRYDISPDFMGMFFADVNTAASGFKQLKEYYEKEYRDLFIPISIRHPQTDISVLKEWILYSKRLYFNLLAKYTDTPNIY